MNNNFSRLEIVGRLRPDEITEKYRLTRLEKSKDHGRETELDLTLLRRQAILAQGELSLLRNIATRIGCRLDIAKRLGTATSLIQDIDEAVGLSLTAISNHVDLEEVRIRFGLLRKDVLNLILRQLENSTEISESAKEDIVVCARRGNVDLENNVSCLRKVLAELIKEAA